MTERILEIDGLKKSFGGVHAVDDCDLVVSEGTVTGLIGPNGSGKSTIINLISGYVRPDEGQVCFQGRRIHQLGPARIYRAGISRTFQRSRVFDEMTVRQNMHVAAPMRLPSIFRLGTPRRVRERAEDLLHALGLLRLAEVPASELSYGQQKLLEFASVLMGEPKLLLLDEPTAGVNANLINVMASQIRDLRAAGVTIALIEHNMEFVMSLCDPVIVFDQGRPIFEGTPSETQASQTVLDAYLGA